MSLGSNGEAILLAQIALLILIGRGVGEIMQRYGQPAVIGQLLAGLILGPSLFGWVWPEGHAVIFPANAEQKNLISGLANIGAMMLLLLTGMETDLKLVRKVGKPAIAVTCMGVAIPFGCGFLLGQFLPTSILHSSEHRLIASLFLGTALSISSIKIVAMVVREMGFTRRNLGQIIVASAVMEDTVGWIIIAMTLGIAGTAGVAWDHIALTMFETAAFLVLSYTLGRKLVFWLIRWVNDTFTSDYAVISAILIVMCVMALITHAIGVNTVLGAFVAGVLIGESPILSRHIEDQLRGFITAFMMPIFFGLSGLSADLTVLTDIHLAELTLVIVVIASFGKFLGAFSGGMISGLSRRESVALGCGLNARGSTEVIVATIGLTMGILTQNLYTMIVTMAIITTTAMPPMLRWALRRVPLSEAESERLAREEADAKGFVSRFERLLIMADESSNGKFVSRIAGFIAGQRGIPITVLPIESLKTKTAKDAAEENGEVKGVVTEGAKEGHRARKEATEEAETPARVEVTTRRTEPARDAVVKEAAKGYDMLFLGVEKMRTGTGLAPAIDNAVLAFDGPVALSVSHEEAGIGPTLNMLVPVNGTEPARRGAEIAFALAPPRSRIVILYVAERQQAGEPNAQTQRRQHKNERALVDDMTQLAQRYGHQNIQVAVHKNILPHEAILKEAKEMSSNLIVMGTSRRVGNRLALGETAATLLSQWKGQSVLVVS